MWRWMKKNRWLAIGLVTVMLFTLLPTNLNWADIAIDEPERASSETRPTEQDKSEEVTTAEETADGTEATTAEAVTTSEAASETVTEAETTTETATVQEMTDNGETVDSTTEAATEVATSAAKKNNDKTMASSSKMNTEPNKADNDSENMEQNDNFHLTDVVLNAEYVDENNVKQTVHLSTMQEAELPADAKIYLYLDFLFSDGNDIEVGKEYKYHIPEALRVDVDAVHELKDKNGTSIGTVHIQKDGTLTFVFNDNVKNQENIPFYVEFEGGFSGQEEEDLGKKKLDFGGAGGKFDFQVDITEPTKTPTQKEPGELGVWKSGKKEIVNGEAMILWTVDIDLNGRKTLDADITDLLPKGLTYAEVAGYPKLEGGSGQGTVSCGAKDGATDLTLRVENADSYYRASVKFYTHYTPDIFEGKITNGSQVLVNNTVNVTEEGTTSSVTGKGSASIYPQILSKTGTTDGKTITWTVTINSDGMDIGGTEYKDTFETGHTWGTAKNVDVSPKEAVSGNVTYDTNGFSFKVNDDWKGPITLTYTTEITNGDQNTYTNKASLDGDNFDLDVSAEVQGSPILTKRGISYNPVTKQFTWEIVVNPAPQMDFGTEEVTLEDIYTQTASTWENKNQVKFKSFTVKDEAGNIVEAGTDTYTDDGNGKLTFHKLGKKTMYVQVVTEATEEQVTGASGPWKDGDWANVTNTAKLTWNGKEVEKDASMNFQYTSPNLIDKSGTLNKDGTIDWVIRFYQQNLEQESITITDQLSKTEPQLEIVAGSVEIMENTWTPDTKVKLDDSVIVDEGKGLNIKIDSNSDENLKYYLQKKDFEIHYKTRATGEPPKGGTTQKYTNDADASVEYADGSTATDGASAVVEGNIGGTLGKNGIYKGGDKHVDWEITVNEGGYDMSSIENPVIRDHLEDYFSYVEGSARLYKLVDGKRTEVTDFKVAVANNEMVVKLPNIGTDTYVFVFSTEFTVTAAELVGKSIVNNVDFEGDGYAESVNSNEVQNVHFSSSSAGASRYEKELRIFKQDKDGKAIPGVTFELWYDGELLATAVTDEDGYACFKGITSSEKGYTYQLKEPAPPTGYTYDAEGAERDIVVTDKSIEANSDPTTGARYQLEKVTNLKIEEGTKTAKFTIHKTGEKGALLKGAGFTLYSDAACEKPVAAKTTDGKNDITFEVEYDAVAGTTYYVKETTVPDGYKGSTVTYEFTVDKDGKVTCDAASGFDETGKTLTVANEKTKGSIQLTKIEKGTTEVIAGAGFTLYADPQCGDEVATATTDTNGIITFDNLIPGRTYYYRETSAPDGYVLDDKVRSVTVGTGKEHENVEVGVTVENEKALGSLKVIKTDDSKNPSKLAGVEFTLTPLGDPDPAHASTKTTDSSGVAVFDGLPFGEYTLTETGKPEGYVASTGQTVVVNSVNEKEITVVNKRIRFKLVITKQDETKAPLEGVMFNVYNSDNALVYSGSTDKDGKITVSDLPYDDYTVKEVKGLPGYTIDNPDGLKVSKTDITDGATITKNFTNTKQAGSIQFKKIIAKDADADNDKMTDTDAGNPLAGAEFSLYNESNELVQKATSGSDGSVKFENLIFGTYTLKETAPPDGYMLTDKVWKVEITANGTYTLTAAGGSSTLLPAGTEYEVENEPIKTKLKYMSFKLNKFDQANNILPGAYFVIYRTRSKAKFTEPADGTTAPDGWEIIGRAYSDKDGRVIFNNVNIEGDYDVKDNVVYRVQEILPPNGYDRGETYYKEYTYSELLDRKWNETDLGYSERKTDSELKDYPVIDTYKNTQITGSIKVIKRGFGSVTPLPGAEFTLERYNAATNKYELYGDEKLTTDENGTLIFKNLPYGTYRVKETKAPKGYVLSVANQKEFKIPGDDGVTLDYTYQVQDAAISVSVNKYAIGGTTQLSGAKLELYDAENMKDCLFSWDTTNREQVLPNTLLEVGKTYVIHEAKAPDGYKLSKDVKFTINEDGSLTYVDGDPSSVDTAGKRVIVRDEPLVLKIGKEGIGGTSDVEQLKGAKICLIDEKTGKTVYTFTSTGKVEDIPMITEVDGKENVVLSLPVPPDTMHYYTVRELMAPPEYALSADIRIGIDLDGNVYQIKTESGSTSNEPLTDNKVTMTDKKYENFYFAKRDKLTKDYLAGAEFSITEVGKTTPTYTWTSNHAPYNVELADGTYIFKEEKAPAGYELEQPIKFEITSDTGKQTITILEGDADTLDYKGVTLTSRDERINVYFQKWGDKHEALTGGNFVLYKTGENWAQPKEKITEFQAEGKAIQLTNTYFELGGYYEIEETAAPSGYTPATEPFRFRIDQDGQAYNPDNQKIQNNVIDFFNGEKQISVQKVDAVTQNSLAGVVLTLSSEDDTDFESETWTTDGTPKYFAFSRFKKGSTYMLYETATVSGYSYAASITFKIEDDETITVNGVHQQTLNIVMENQPLAVSVDKYVLGTTDYLAGATMQVTDADGNVLEQWETGNGAHALDVSKLQVSTADAQHVYTLKEVKAPDLYALAQPISFTIDKNGVVSRVDGGAVTDNHLVVYDEYRGMSISKQDMGGKEVPGATLMITSEQDPDFVPKSWVTTDTPMNWNMDMFKRNVDYILTETAAPDGYAYTESIVFRIDDNGVIYVNGAPVTNKTVTMVDDVLKLSIAKRIDGRKKLLAGAKLEILDEETETTVYSWKSTDEVKEIPHKKLKASSDTTRYVYILRETKAPEGYEKAKDIRFYIDKQGNVYTLNKKGKATLVSDHVITMYDKKTDAKTSTKTTSKKTGDTAPVALAGIMFSLSLAGAGTAYGLRRRKARKK